VDHPRRVVDGVSFVFKFYTDRMYGLGDIAILIFAIGLGISIDAPALSQIMLLIVLTPKRPSFGGTTSFELQSMNINRSVRAGRWNEKKGSTGQEKVTKGLYFTYLGRSPH